MTTEIKQFFIKAITPLHVGSGSDLGVVDMPIQRESHTGFPKIEASSLKGSIRSEFTEQNSEEDAKKIFGTGDKAGDIGFSDAKILFFPVKSVKGVFAYISCPMVLKRLEEDLELGDNEEFTLPKINVSDEECIVFSDKNSINANVILEEYSFIIANKKDANKKMIFETFNIVLPSFNELKTRLVIISDDNFTHFVKNSTEVITRIKIGEDGVVDKKAGALFTEEYLPSETIMYALALGEINKFIENTPDTLQIGGNSTLGKGICELTISVKKEEQSNGE